MNKSELVDKFSNILSVRQGTAEDLVDGLISAVKEECCSGELKWEPIPGWIDPISIKPSESNQSWHRQMFDVFVAGISKKECAGCVSEHFSKSEPSCLKPGCKREQHINAKTPKPQLIQGYTAENWQEIIDGGYLCEFSFSTDFDRVYSSLLSDHGHDEHEGTHYFHPVNDKTNDFLCCRPAQIKGVMRPIFVEPVDKDVDVVFFDSNGFPIGDGSCISTEGVSYVWEAWREKVKRRGATKYIEL